MEQIQPTTSSTKRYQLGYSYYRYEQAETQFLRQPATLAPETLCWVLQSKGKKQRRKHTTKSSLTTDNTKQRKELLSRAWIIGSGSSSIEATQQDHDDKNDNNCNNHKKRHKDRILVRYPKGSTYHVKPENLLPVLMECRLVIVLPETHLYRRWALVHTQPKDSFCEIGCDVGILVHRIWEHSLCPKHVSGIDKSEADIDQAQQRYPQIQFQTWNVPLLEEEDDENNNDKGSGSKTQPHDPSVGSASTTTPLPMDLFPQPPSDRKDNDNTDDTSPIMNASLVVAIDINGNRELQAVQKCIQIVIQEWKPRLIFVKSRALYADLKQQE